MPMIVEWFRIHWADLAVLAGIAWFARDGWRRGFFAVGFELLGYAVALLAALLFYPPVAAAISYVFDLARPFAKPVAFVLVWLATEYGFSRLLLRIQAGVPRPWLESHLNRATGIIPATAVGTLIAAVTLTVLAAMPLHPDMKRSILDSASGSTLITAVSRADRTMSSVFGIAFKETLSFVTAQDKVKGGIDLHFTTSDFMPSPDAERAVLALVNEERSTRGLKPLVSDLKLVALARAHSADMLQGGWFAHVSPPGKSPTDRADESGYAYLVFGENLALAPDVAAAHAGLMASPGHRANILSPFYVSVGIGVMDAGPYGLMISQEFAR